MCLFYGSCLEGEEEEEESGQQQRCDLEHVAQAVGVESVAVDEVIGEEAAAVTHHQPGHEGDSTPIGGFGHLLMQYMIQ